MITQFLKAPLIPFKAFKLEYVMVALIGMLYLMADLAWPDFAMEARSVLLIYIVMFLLTDALLRDKEIKQPGNLGGFLMGFLLTAVVLLAVSLGVPWLRELITYVISPAGVIMLPFGITFALAAAYLEERMFRGSWPAAIGDVGSAILFGVFHIAVLITVGGLAFPIIPVLTLIGLGLFWAKMRSMGGIMMSSGSHFAYNLWAVGILLLVLGGI